MTRCENTYVVFVAGGERYGVPVRRVTAIVRPSAMTPVPRAPEAVMGVMNMRGTVLPVVDISRRLGRGTFVPGPNSRVIVADGPFGIVGLAVDAATDVTCIDADLLGEAPEGVLGADVVRMFTGVADCEDGLLLLIDVDEAVPAPSSVPAGISPHTKGDADG